MAMVQTYLRIRDSGMHVRHGLAETSRDIDSKPDALFVQELIVPYMLTARRYVFSIGKLAIEPSDLPTHKTLLSRDPSKQSMPY